MGSVRRTVKATGMKVLSSLPSKARSPVVEWYVHRKLQHYRSSKTPSLLTFFVTNKCNARCAHCFYWGELNQKVKELSLDEIARIVRSLDQPVDLSVTGGEPTIRVDLVDVCRLFIRDNRCRTIGIASNGSFPERLLECTEQLLLESELESLSVQVSLDGPQLIHDAIRRIPGGYGKAIECLQALRQLSITDKRFQVFAALAIQRSNIDHIEEFIAEMVALGICHRFIVLRGNSYGTYALPKEATSGIDPMDVDTAEIPLERLNEVMGRITTLEAQTGFAFWPQGDRLINDATMRILNTQQAVLPCYAGRVDAVLYPDGEVALCELSRSVGNVRDYDLNFAALWSASRTNDMRRLTSKCYCIHSCALGTSMQFDAKYFDKIRFGTSASQDIHSRSEVADS